MVIDSMGKGGKERRLLELLKGFRSYPDVRCELVLLSKRVDYPEVHELGIPIYMLERKPKQDPRVFFRFFRIAKKFQPDIIHSWGSMPSVYALPTVRLLNITFINAMIADAPAFMKWYQAGPMRARLTFPSSKLVIGNSQAGLKSYKAPEGRRACVYNGYDFRRSENLEDPLEIRTRFNISTPMVVGMVGGFAPRKDYFTYIRAALNVLKTRDDVSFLAIGSGANLSTCKAMVPDKFSNRIIFTGAQQGVESIMNILDVGVLTTNHKIHGEGISNSIMEYMALGKPVVATRGGGTPEIVVDGETGFIIEPYSDEALAEKIIHLLDHPQQAQKMGTAGQERVKKHFNLKDMAANYYRIYQDLLGKTHGVYTH